MLLITCLQYFLKAFEDSMNYINKSISKLCSGHYLFNPYSPNVTFLYPLQTSENPRFSDVFREYRNVTLEEYGLKPPTKTNNKSNSTIFRG